MRPNFFDIHSHLNFPDFDKDREQIIEKILREKIWTIVMGTNERTSLNALEISRSYKRGIYAGVGCHPTESENFSIKKLKEMTAYEKVVAIGECGLDYFRIKDEKLKIKQRENFIRQIELALEVDKPLMIHCRDAHKDVIEILSSYSLIHRFKLRGNIHFFSGEWKEAQRYFELGFTVSFAGVITFSTDYDEIIKRAPLEKILAETDSPFVAPVPYRGKRNEPFYIREVIKKMAQIKNISDEEMASITVENALNLFKIKTT